MIDTPIIQQKLLSICIPTFNRRTALNLLLAAIASEVQGVEHLIELCISDNASSDGTKEFLKEWEPQEKIATRIHFNPINRGLDANVLQVLSMAEGKWMWLLGDDDLPYPDGLTKLLEFLVQIKDAQCVCLYLPLGCKKGEEQNTLQYEPESSLDSKGLVIGPVVFISAIALKRSAFRSLNPKDIQKGLGTGFMHCWILRLIGLSFPEAVVQIPQFPVVIGYISAPRLVVSIHFFYVAGMKKQYWKLLWLILSKRGYSSQYQSWVLKKTLGASLFPYFQLLCEREFRPWKRERIPFSTFRCLFGLFTPFAMLFRTVIWRLPPKHHHAMFNRILLFVGKLRITKRTDYDYWQRFWGSTYLT